MDTPTGKVNKKGEPIIREGYVDKPKGMRQVAWERGWHKPEGEGKMHGDKIPEEGRRDQGPLPLAALCAGELLGLCK